MYKPIWWFPVANDPNKQMNAPWRHTNRPGLSAGLLMAKALISNTTFNLQVQARLQAEAQTQILKQGRWFAKHFCSCSISIVANWALNIAAWVITTNNSYAIINANWFSGNERLERNASLQFHDKKILRREFDPNWKARLTNGPNLATKLTSSSSWIEQSSKCGNLVINYLWA